jgi:hypothetical protein
MLTLIVKSTISNPGKIYLQNWEQKGSEKGTKKHWLINYICVK